MFYEPKNGHGLPHNPFNALIIPRPIGWISTVSKNGVANLSPYSFFTGVAYEPPQVMFSSVGKHAFGGMKDSLQNIQDTSEFVVNMATVPLLEKVNASSVAAPHEVDEFDLVELTKAPCEIVTAPRVAESPIHMECKLTQVVPLKTKSADSANIAVFGEVVGIHIDESYLVDGILDMKALNPLSRLGYLDFGGLGDTFTRNRPTWKA